MQHVLEILVASRWPLLSCILPKTSSNCPILLAAPRVLEPKYFGISVVRAVLYEQGPVRSPPIELAAHVADHQLHASSSCSCRRRAPRLDPPDAVFKCEGVAMWTHVRQRDSSYSVTWFDDSPQKNSFTQKALGNAYPAFVFHSTFVAAISYLHIKTYLLSLSSFICVLDASIYHQTVANHCCA